jgi:polar amino acid transport system substrate-binding protein
MSIRFARARAAPVTVVLAAVVLAAAGGDQWAGPSAPDLMTVDPRPAAAARPAAEISSGQAPATSGCTPENLRDSLRPQGPLPAPGQMPAGSTMARITQRGYLVASVNKDIPPFSFRDENLRMQGFDIDIVRDIAGAIFGDRERVVFRLGDVADRVSTTRSGNLDLTVSTLTITCKRRDQVDFSTVYYEAGQRVLVNRGSAVTGLGDLGGKRVCAARGSTSLGKILAATPKPISVGEATETDCLALLQLGEVDAISTDDTLLAGIAAQDPRTEIIGPRFSEEPYGVAINKDTPDLVRFVNAVLERRAQDGRWRASYERWLTPLGPPPSPPTPHYRD